MANTSIEWTDKVWNPVTGCTKVSQGCKNCYAERIFPRAYGHSVMVRPIGEEKPRWRKFTDVETHSDRLDQPLHWKKPARIFVNSMSDLFHEAVPFEFIDQVWAVMALADKHTYQILTKRPERMHAYFNTDPVERIPEIAYDLWTQHLAPGAMGSLKTWVEHGESLFDLDAWPLPNVHLGVSVEDQPTAEERIRRLLQTPAAVRFISAEPLLGPIEGLQRWFCCEPASKETHLHLPCMDWVIAGGESGPGARPMHPDWARSLRDQCVAAGVPFFFKQWGEWAPLGPITGKITNDQLVRINCSDEYRSAIVDVDGQILPTCGAKSKAWMMERVGKKAAGHMLDGREWREFPR